MNWYKGSFRNNLTTNKNQDQQLNSVSSFYSNNLHSFIFLVNANELKWVMQIVKTQRASSTLLNALWPLNFPKNSLLGWLVGRFKDNLSIYINNYYWETMRTWLSLQQPRHCCIIIVKTPPYTDLNSPTDLLFTSCLSLASLLQNAYGTHMVIIQRFYYIDDNN